MNELPISRSGLFPFAETSERWLARLSLLAPIRIDLGGPPGRGTDIRANGRGGIVAEAAVSPHAVPEVDRAALDGWAMASASLVSASAYAPAMLMPPPAFVAIGEAMPEGCDCVVENKFVSLDGPMSEVRVSAAPGAGVLRVGDDVCEGAQLFRRGDLVDATTIALAKAAGLSQLMVRRPAVRLIDVSDSAEPGPTTTLIGALIEEAGAHLSIDRAPRKIEAVANAFQDAKADLIVTIGATGDGPDDVIANAIRQAGTLEAHRLAIHPGRTTALGTIGRTPVLAMSGRAPDAFAIALTLLLPALRRLSGSPEPETGYLSLTRKITSQIGFAELALLRREGTSCMPIAIGTLPLSSLTLFDAWALFPAASEGYAAGTTITANLFREHA
ncbi:molybdopterin-binding protein [Fulvimarina sp. MAC3]|uniref:molybdopterin-binding protein n=1 Tax=Fulvimarina sp. MAC3 TaxID=3148887 RepID=UPI0031FCBD04